MPVVPGLNSNTRLQRCFGWGRQEMQRRALSRRAPRHRRLLAAAVLAAVGALASVVTAAHSDLGFSVIAGATRRSLQREPLCGRRLLVAKAATGDSEFRLWAPNQRVVEAIEKAGGRVTKADVLERGAEASGLDRELTYLARATGASMQVNDKGELLYGFPRDLRGALSATNSAAKLQEIVATVSPILSYAGRVLFGVSLLATVAVLYSAVLILLTTSTSDREDRNGNRGSVISQNNFAMWFGQDLFFWLQPRPYNNYTYYGGYWYEERPKLSFFESIFSFVFGDGDPNKPLLEETRWQMVGQVITENGGAVVAEQVAPYLDPPEDTVVDEVDRTRALNKAMLPVLTRFRGRPEVSEKGEIVYVFPEMQESRAAGELIVGDVSTEELQERLRAMRRPVRAKREDVVDEYRRAIEEMRKGSARSGPAFLQEQQLKFSEADEGQVAASVAYGTFAFFATLFFGSQILTGKALILAQVYPIIGLLTKGFPFLLGYTGFFLGFPLWRWLKLPGLNEVIQQRNAWREEQTQKLSRPDGWLRDKLVSAANWARKKQFFGEAIFDSSKSASERSAADELKAFDEQLKGKR